MKLVNKIGLGTVQFGLDYGISNTSGITGIDEVQRIFNVAIQAGIHVLDTAHAYGNSEAVLGEIGIEKFEVVTKFQASTPNECVAQVDASLHRLKSKFIYGLLSHNVNDLTDNYALWVKMIELKESGIIKKIGFSFNKLAEVDAILKTNIVPDIIQIPYNIVDKRFRDIAIYYREKGCEIHSRSTFLQGLFFCDPETLNDSFMPIKDFIHDLQRYTSHLSSSLLLHCLNETFIDRVIIGVNNSEQLKATLTTLKDGEAINLNIPKLEEAVLAPSEWKLI